MSPSHLCRSLHTQVHSLYIYKNWEKIQECWLLSIRSALGRWRWEHRSRPSLATQWVQSQSGDTVSQKDKECSYRWTSARKQDFKCLLSGKRWTPPYTEWPSRATEATWGIIACEHSIEIRKDKCSKAGGWSFCTHSPDSGSTAWREIPSAWDKEEWASDLV